MQEVSFEEALELVQAKDRRYTREAYLFVREALDHTQKAKKDTRSQGHHVSGLELLNGIRDFALAQYGPMAITLFEEWGIHSCKDFGEIVFNMVDIGWLAKTDRDSRADFQDGYDFYDTLRRPFLPSDKQKSTDRNKPVRPPEIKL